MELKAAFHTLGCKVNSYETQAILEQFEASGFTVVDYSEKADVYVVNTCSVTGEAARKSRQILNRARKQNPEAVTVATGCYVQEAYKMLNDSADILIGNNEKSKIIDAVKELLKQKNIRSAGIGDNKTDNTHRGESEDRREGCLFIDDLTHCTDYEEQDISGQGDHVRAYVKIQDGCNRFCSYCIIPYLRGRSRSRSADDIITEIRRLAASGYKEIVITGIDISDYRYFKSNDPNIKDDNEKNKGVDLIRLLRDIDDIEGIKRIRLGSLEEGIVTENFAKEAKKIKHLCPHFHLSLQSGSDTVLKRMNRKYTTKEFGESIGYLRKYFDDPGITTDIIVGFPGETEEEFKETLKFVEKTGFSAIHVFKYSRRKGTVADRMEDHLTDKIKSERSEMLMQLGMMNKEKFINGSSKKTTEVLIEEKINENGKEYIIGFTPEYIKVKLDAGLGKVNDIIKVDFNKVEW